MGLKISQMNELFFLKGGGSDGLDNEFLEIAANEGNPGTLTTFRAKSQDIAALSAPFRFIINHQYETSNASSEFLLARLSILDIIREQIRYNLETEYEPGNPATYPSFNTFVSGVMKISVVTGLSVDGGSNNYYSTTVDLTNTGSSWNMQGMTGNAAIEFQSIPSANEYGGMIPESISLVTEDDIQGLNVYGKYSTASLPTGSTFTYTVFGYVDGTFVLANLA